MVHNNISKNNALLIKKNTDGNIDTKTYNEEPNQIESTTFIQTKSKIINQKILFKLKILVIR